MKNKELEKCNKKKKRAPIICHPIYLFLMFYQFLLKMCHNYLDIHLNFQYNYQHQINQKSLIY